MACEASARYTRRVWWSGIAGHFHLNLCVDQIQITDNEELSSSSIKATEVTDQVTPCGCCWYLCATVDFFEFSQARRYAHLRYQENYKLPDERSLQQARLVIPEVVLLIRSVQASTVKELECLQFICCPLMSLVFRIVCRLYDNFVSTTSSWVTAKGLTSGQYNE